MKKLFWYIKRIWQLSYQYTLEKRWKDRYRSAKLSLGLPGVDDCSKFTRINTLDRGSREAFLRALIIEVTDHNRSLYSSSNELIRWRQIFAVIENLGIWGVQKSVYDLMKKSDSKAVSSFDVKNFESHNPEDKIVIQHLSQGTSTWSALRKDDLVLYILLPISTFE